jgi:predicted ATPase/class 3 adenylate cyclase
MPAVRSDLPSGTVTFLFTDVEGSTKLLHELGPAGYADELAEHRRILREAFTAEGGVEVDTQGDAFFVAFPTELGALSAARAINEGLKAGRIRVRMGLHTGTPLLTDEGYVGSDVHRAARIGAAGHGGQVLVSATTAAIIGRDGLHDLGEHRLKDFDQPTPIYQLGDERFPPLKTISNTNLPRRASSFVGREAEVAQVSELLRNGARLVTLTGPGGSGKTRLAIEAATALISEFKAGVFWVDLAPLRDPKLVTETIGQVIGAQDGLADHIAERQMLLLLDNLEQVIDAAAELATLVEACPNLRLLVTSRERLRVRGEVELPVAPLADLDAVELFCARAQVEADETVQRLCHALDNLPLAVELAAARASVLTPAQMLDRLSGRLDLLKGGRDADPRQMTLRATIEWSHELLTADEQQLFARLGVFVGGWTLDAAETVVAAELDGLQSLVDKSLVRHIGDRFDMLETIREFAAERFSDSAEIGEVRNRHAAYFLEQAENALPHLRAEELGGGGPEWLNHQARELDNHRAALDHLLAGDDPQLPLRLAGALVPAWGNLGHISEGRSRLAEVLRRDVPPTAARGRALDGAAELAHYSGETDLAAAFAKQAIAIYEAVDDKYGLADSTISLGAALGEGGDWMQARPLFERSLELFRELGDERRVMWTTRSVAWANWALGDRSQARAQYEEALRMSRAAGNRLFEAIVLGALSGLSLDEGRIDDARARMVESLRIRPDDQGLSRIAIALDHAADLLGATGNPLAAARLIGAFDAMMEDIGGSEPWVVKMRDDTLSAISEALAPGVIATALEEGRKLTPDRALAIALEALEA